MLERKESRKCCEPISLVPALLPRSKRELTAREWVDEDTLSLHWVRLPTTKKDKHEKVEELGTFSTVSPNIHT